MSLNLDIVINTPDQSVAMKAGLGTLQGISDAAHCIDGAALTEKVLLLKTEGSIPIEIISSALGWEEVLFNNLPFIITIVIVLGAAIVTYNSNRKSIESQNTIASKNRNEEHENKISEFRHRWIQEVRDTSSKLVQRIYDIQYYYNLNKKLETKVNEIIELSPTSKHMESMKDELIISNKSLFSNISEFHKTEAKFRLLFKPDDAKNLLVFTHINDVVKKVKSLNIECIGNESTDLIVSELQIVLKKEWEVTKDRSWHKNT